MKLYVFVYGTLKKGYGNDRYYCQGYKEVIKGEITGQLYDLNAFPMAEIGDDKILYSAGDSFAEDLLMTRKVKDWEAFDGEKIIGEIVSFEGTEAEIHNKIAGFDSLEGHPTFYERVLVPSVDINGKERLVWTYRCPSGEKPSGWLLENGKWPAEHEKVTA